MRKYFHSMALLLQILSFIYLGCFCTGRGDRGGGGAFLLRGAVPPCIDEVADGICWDCMQANASYDQLETNYVQSDKGWQKEGRRQVTA